MEKKWALVTGASSGIGLAYAEELASRGYQLVIVSNEEQAIREKGEFLSEKYGIEVLPLYRDLAIPGAAKELYDTCQEKNIPIEVLVNNAGMWEPLGTGSPQSAVQTDPSAHSTRTRSRRTIPHGN